MLSSIEVHFEAPENTKAWLADAKMKRLQVILGYWLVLGREHHQDSLHPVGWLVELALCALVFVQSPKLMLLVLGFGRRCSLSS